jgi:hypothetical protein
MNGDQKTGKFFSKYMVSYGLCDCAIPSYLLQ